MILKNTSSISKITKGTTEVFEVRNGEDLVWSAFNVTYEIASISGATVSPIAPSVNGSSPSIKARGSNLYSFKIDPNLESLDNLFYQTRVSRILDFPNMANVTSAQCVFSASFVADIESVLPFINGIKDSVKNIRLMFSGLGLTGSPLDSLDLSAVTFSKVENARNLFDRTKVHEIKAPGFGVGSKADIGYLFSICDRTTSIDVSSIDTSNMSSIKGVFYGCSSLTSVDISMWDTGKATSCASLFDSCDSLMEFKTKENPFPKVTDASGLFRSCSKLSSIDISDWCGSVGLKTVTGMFAGCENLETVSLPESYPVGYYCTGVDSMFEDCNKLKTINGKFPASNKSFDLTSPVLDASSAVKAVEAQLQQNYETKIRFHADVFAKIPESVISAAANKNWVVEAIS